MPRRVVYPQKITEYFSEKKKKRERERERERKKIVTHLGTLGQYWCHNVKKETNKRISIFEI